MAEEETQSQEEQSPQNQGDQPQAGDQGPPEQSGQPHPLESGGVRFNEVYAQMKAYQARAEQAERLLSQSQTQTSPPPNTRPSTPTYSADQLQTAVNAGQITQAQMAEQLAFQHTRDMERRIEEKMQWQLLASEAQREVEGFLAKKPEALTDARVLSAAAQIQRETGWDGKDPRLARRALREVYGSLDRVAQVRQARDMTREGADTGGEPGGRGGGEGPTRTAGGDPLAKIDAGYLEYWKSKGYSRERMLELSKHIQRPFPGYRAAVHGRLGQAK